jgi:hypothetical protein
MPGDRVLFACVRNLLLLAPGFGMSSASAATILLSPGGVLPTVAGHGMGSKAVAAGVRFAAPIPSSARSLTPRVGQYKKVFLSPIPSFPLHTIPTRTCRAWSPAFSLLRALCPFEAYIYNYPPILISPIIYSGSWSWRRGEFFLVLTSEVRLMACSFSRPIVWLGIPSGVESPVGLLSSGYLRLG